MSQNQPTPQAVDSSAGSQQGDAKDKKKFVPENGELRIAVSQQPRSCMGRARTILETFHKIDIHALGEATPTAVRVAENLQRHGVAKITKIETQTYPSDETGSVGDKSSRKKIKIIISLEEVKSTKTN